MNTNLADRIATYVDGTAPPVTAAEAIARPFPMQSPSRSHPVLVAALCALVLTAGFGMWRWATTGTTERGVAVEPPAEVASCGHPPADLGCPVGADAASSMLGIALPDPDGIPAGWVVQDYRVRFWPAGSLSPGVPAAATADYRQVWAPAGADLTAVGSTDPYLQLTREALTSAGPAYPSLNDLSGSPGGVRAGGALEWQSNGIHYRLFSTAVSGPDLLAIANSLP